MVLLRESRLVHPDKVQQSEAAGVALLGPLHVAKAKAIFTTLQNHKP